MQCAYAKCNNEIPSRNKYCSSKCSGLSRRKIDLWLSGEWDGTVRAGLADSVRTFLLEEAGFKCQDGSSGCNNWSGFNRKTGKTCLQIEHKDGNSFNNQRSNLIVLCPNCHSMTETYGALNKGYGRASRY